MRTTPAGDGPRVRPTSSSYERLKPGPGQSRIDVIASQKARLQRAVMDLAAQDGLGSVTVRNLTRLAGVSTGSFYARFSGTDQCLLAAYSEVTVGATRTVAGTRAADLEPADQVDTTLRTLLDYLAADRVVARFALIEIYGGGPAALAAVNAAERRLELAIRACLDRRSRRVQEKMPAAILAAALHCARVRLIDASPEEARANGDALIAWARDVVDGKEEYAATGAGPRMADFGEPAWPGADGSSDHDERNLILAAVLRLAAPNGFFGLTAGKVSSAAGVPTSRFRRHFSDVADGYLAAIRRTCHSFFIELTDDADREAAPRVSVRSALRRTSHRAALEPAAAQLTFRGIVEPGVPGLTCRDALISELAVACSGGPQACGPSIPVRAEARAAAFWADLAMMAPAGARRN